MLDVREGLADDPADSPSPIIRTRQRIDMAVRLVGVQAPLAAPLVGHLLQLVLDEVTNLSLLLQGALDDTSRLIADMPEQAELEV